MLFTIVKSVLKSYIIYSNDPKLLNSIFKWRKKLSSPRESGIFFLCCIASHDRHLFDSQVYLHCWLNWEFIAESIICCAFVFFFCFEWCQYYCYSFFSFPLNSLQLHHLLWLVKIYPLKLLKKQSKGVLNLLGCTWLFKVLHDRTYYKEEWKH